MPFAMAVLILLAKNPDLSNKLGLLGDKSNLIAYSATDWSAYLQLTDEVISAGGFFFFIIGISWIFGREFVDGTLKDLLAVPISRLVIVMAKFIVALVWFIAMAILILILSLVMGAIIRLPAGSLNLILHGSVTAAITACMIIVSVMPFALLASLGRGYILPMAAAVLALIVANLLMVVGWAEYFPWAVALLYAQGPNSLTAVSYWILIITSLVGMAATYLWWMYADQNR
jgi:ABC-2 type transport system permease protein